MFARIARKAGIMLRAENVFLKKMILYVKNYWKKLKTGGGNHEHKSDSNIIGSNPGAGAGTVRASVRAGHERFNVGTISKRY
jgi:hypothetical protein